MNPLGGLRCGHPSDACKCLFVYSRKLCDSLNCNNRTFTGSRMRQGVALSRPRQGRWFSRTHQTAMRQKAASAFLKGSSQDLLRPQSPSPSGPERVESNGSDLSRSQPTCYPPAPSKGRPEVVTSDLQDSSEPASPHPKRKGKKGSGSDSLPIIIIHLLGLAPAGYLAAPDSGP
jgi:hypothetical protein